MNRIEWLHLTKTDFLWEVATCLDGVPSPSMLHKPIVSLQVCAWCIYDCCSCGVPTLSPLLTSHSHPSWECFSPFISPNNIPLGRTELVGSLGAETPPTSPASFRAKWEWGQLRRDEDLSRVAADFVKADLKVWRFGAEGEGRRVGSEDTKKQVKGWKKEGRRSWRSIWLIKNLKGADANKTLRRNTTLTLCSFTSFRLTLLIWLPMFPLFFYFPILTFWFHSRVARGHSWAQSRSLITASERGGSPPHSSPRTAASGSSNSQTESCTLSRSGESVDQAP